MTRKKKPLRMAPLQRLAVKPIRDPAEQAALDAQFKKREEAAAPVSMASGASSKVTAAVVLQLCRQLSTRARLNLASELVLQFSVEQCIQLLERGARQLPAEFRRQLAQGLLESLGDAGEPEKIIVGEGKPGRVRSQEARRAVGEQGQG